MPSLPRMTDRERSATENSTQMTAIGNIGNIELRIESYASLVRCFLIILINS